MPPEYRYHQDPPFRRLVDHFEAGLDEAIFSPADLREAAALAAKRHELRPRFTLTITFGLNVDDVQALLVFADLAERLALANAAGQ